MRERPWGLRDGDTVSELLIVPKYRKIFN
jgi:hypothetical protein